MKTSLSSFVYFNYPLEEAIRRTAAAGFEGIDLWGGRPHAYCQDLSEREIFTLRRLIQSEGLEVASFIPAQFRYPTSLCSPISTIYRDSIRYIQQSVEVASALGAPVVSVCPGHTLFGQSKEDGLGRLGGALWEISEYAARHGIRIAVEPADQFETDLLMTCQDTLRFVQDLGCENLGVLLDNGHAQITGESSVEAVQALGSSLFHIHVDDNNGLRDQHLVPGEGCFAFDPFVRVLRETGYQGFLGAELGWDYTVDPDPAVQLTSRRLEAFLNQAVPS